MLNIKLTLLQVIQGDSSIENFSVILYSSLQVGKKLRQLAAKGGPDEQDFSKLAKDVEHFTVSLVDPLKANDGHREVFSAGIDLFVDQAIEKDQKKVKTLEPGTDSFSQCNIQTTYWLIFIHTNSSVEWARWKIV